MHAACCAAVVNAALHALPDAALVLAQQRLGRLEAPKEAQLLQQVRQAGHV